LAYAYLTQLKKLSGSDFWRKAINKEMLKVKVAWKTYEGNTPDQVYVEAKSLNSEASRRLDAIWFLM
jgi:hypothetical protein